MEYMCADDIYQLGFSVFPGIGPLKFKALLSHFGTAKNAWSATGKDLLGIGMGVKLTDDFIKFRGNFSLLEFQRSLAEKKIQYISQTDHSYPELLKEIPDPPILLYVRGDAAVLSEVQPRIGVVGTRKMTEYGLSVTQQLTKGLVNAGFAIVSGMAYGIDTVSHESAIAAGGKTIAILGSGIDVIHPVSNTRLYWSIVKKYGCVVSEFPPGMFTSKGLFPSRNRIISGMSLGVLVTEGAEDSGSLITATCALEQGREVFAVPGPITSSLSRGPTKLLKNGAKMVTGIEDILEEFNIKYQKSNIKNTNQISNSNLTSEERRIIEILRNEGLHFDEMVRKSGMVAKKLAGILSVMEIKGYIKSEDGGIYRMSSAA